VVHRTHGLLASLRDAALPDPHPRGPAPHRH
jgi:hypothetical protein